MDTGFGQNLEGFLIKGNLSIAPAALPFLQGDGSLEGSGTLYFDIIREYNSNTGVTLQDVSFKNGVITIPYTFPSTSVTTGSLVIDGGISIKNTSQSTNTCNGGALTIAGGASIAKNLHVGGILDVHDNRIINVSLPSIGTDAANKNYVDSVADRVSGNFTTGQIIIAETVGSAIRGYDFFRTDTTNLYASIPFVIENTNNSTSVSSGSLIVKGGVAIEKDVNITGTVNLNNNVINNLGEPLNSSDAVTKNYVDSKTYGNILGSFGENQVLIGTSSENALVGYNNFTFDGTTLQLGTLGSFVIQNSQSGTSLTDNNSLITYGGASFYQNVFIGQVLDVNGNIIKNVGYPTNSTDAANKQYVDEKIISNTAGNINGNFTTGQVIIADSNGDAIRGFNNLTFLYDGTVGTLRVLNSGIQIDNTQNAIGLGTGGTLTTLGGASFQKNVYIGGGLDVNVKRITNVDDPIEDLDAVNKLYVDNFIGSISQNISGNSFTLNNNVLIPEDIPNFYYPTFTKAFIANVYVQYNAGKYAIYTLYGYKCDSSWNLLTSFVGDITNIGFDIREAAGQGVLQYTNTNTLGISAIKFATVLQVNNEANANQTNHTLSPNVTTFTDISPLTFLNSDLTSIKLVVHISSVIDSKCGVYLLNCLRKGTQWVIHSTHFGNLSGLEFDIRSTGSSGIIQYKNANNAVDYTLRLRRIRIQESDSSITLLANTFSPAQISNSEFIFTQNDSYFNLTVYAENTTLNKYALYELQGAIHSTTWKLNARYIGDDLGIKFNIDSISGAGYITYTNSKSSNTIIKFVASTPATFQPLSVSKGGTGNDYLEPYAVLRGNGTDPIVGTNDFIYQDYKLILGNVSSIVLLNTQTATSLTNGGTLTSYGGASFAKDVFIGGQLDVNLNRITSVQDPIEDYDAVNKLYVDTEIDNIDFSNIQNDPLFEYNLALNNNVTTPIDIPNFCFDPSTKAFLANIFVTVNDQTFALYTIRGINSGSNWILSTSFTGQPTGVQFHIQDHGDEVCVQYTNSNTAGASFIKYRVSSKVEDLANTAQTNIALNPNVVTMTNIPGLSFLNSNVNSVKLIIYVSSETASKYGLFMCNIVLKNNTWDLNTHSIGNIDNINFGIATTATSVQLQYTNTNVENDYVIRVKQLNVLDSETSYTLAASTTTPAVIDNSVLAFDNTKDNYFLLTAYVYVPTLFKYALFEIQGILDNNIWNINSRYIGDNTGIKFNISTINEIGYLTFTNENGTDAFIKVVRDIPLTTLKPLQINKGGTGSTYFHPYTVLRGNGTNQIIGTNDFIYQNNQLILGDFSSIVLTSTQDSTTLVSNGGITVDKNLTVGQKLIVSNVDITPSKDDISTEKTFYAQNNQNIPQNVTGFSFQSPTKSFSGITCVTIETNSDSYDCLFDVKGIRKNSGWTLYSSNVGDDVGISFSITTSGQIQYTSTNILDWVSTTMKFRAITTTL